VATIFALLGADAEARQGSPPVVATGPRRSRGSRRSAVDGRITLTLVVVFEPGGTLQVADATWASPSIFPAYFWFKLARNAPVVADKSVLNSLPPFIKIVDANGGLVAMRAIVGKPRQGCCGVARPVNFVETITVWEIKGIIRG